MCPVDLSPVALQKVASIVNAIKKGTRFFHVVGLSGGIDSQATLRHVRERFGDEEKIALNTHAGRNECGVTVKFLEDFSKDVFPVITITPLVIDLADVGTKPGATQRRRSEYSDEDELTFVDLAYIKGRFPSRKAQFCTEYLKLRPQQRWLRSTLTNRGVGFKRYIGVRRDESTPRRNAADCDYDTFFGCETERPVASWTKQQCFEYVQSFGEEVNPLYKMGFSRVGCAPCVNAKKDDIREWAARFPEVIQKVRDWEQVTKRTFFAPMVPGLEINWIDDVVAWSKTAWGGRQPLLSFVEDDAQAGACVSQFGLCE
ncbi:MAG: phosphoadenosine phosphosulfate reductase family protein [Acidobacteria bacterium]|nr:phosphoadenosine phosphosulfate reductase family protein [Acidobacteriota bacterium]